MSVSKAFMNAFDRMGSQGSQLTLIEEHTRGTKESVAVGGALYEKLNELTTAIVDIKEGGKGGVKGALGGAANALAIAVVAPAMEPIAKGFQLLVDAVNALESTGDETKAKMEGLVSGLVLLGDVGKSILAFAGYMFLATPLLAVVAVMSPLIGIALFATIGAIQLATKFLDEKKLEKVKMLKDVGLGILAFTASLAISSLFIQPAIKGAFGAAVALGVIALVFRLIPDKALDNMVKVKDVLLKVGLGILAVMTSLALSSLIGPMALKGAFFAGIAILAIGGAFYLLEKMKIMDKIEDGAKGLLLAAGAILGLGIALALFNIIAPPLPVLLTVFAIVAGVGIAFALVGIVGKKIEDGAMSLIFAGLAIIVLALSLKILAAVAGNITGEEAVKSLGALLLIGLIGAAFYLAGTQAPIIAAGAAAMILVGIAVIILSAGVAVMSKALGDRGWEFIGQMSAVIVGVGLAMAGAGAAAIFIIPGAAAMILAGGALISIALGLKAMSKLTFNSGALAGSGKMTEPNKFLKFLGVKAREKTNLEVALEAVANSFTLNPLRIASMYASAPALIMAGLALTSIGAGIKSFQRISESADLSSLSENVRTIVSALSDEFARIGKEHGGAGGFLGIGKGFVTKGIEATRGMGRSLTGIAKGVQAMAMLRFPTGFDKDGNPTGFETINLTSAIPNLITNTQDIIRGLTSVYAEIGAGDGAKGSTWFTKSPYEKGVKMVRQMGEPLASLATGVQNMANLKFPTGYDSEGNPTGYKGIGGSLDDLIDKIKENTKKLIRGLSGVFVAIGSDENGASTSSWWQGSTTFEKGVEIALALGDPFSKLAKSAKDAQAVMDFEFNEDSLKAKTKAMVAAFLAMGMVVEGQNLDMDDTVDFVADITKSYKSMAKSMPKITEAIGSYNVESGDAFTKNMVMIGGGPDATEKQLMERRLLWKAIGSNMTLSAEAMPEITESINDMDLAKLTETRQMFEALAALSQGGEPADILAEMGESLEQALQNLADMLGEFKSSVGEGMAATAESGGLVSGAIDKIGGMISGGGSSSGGDNGQVVSAIRQLHKALTASGIKIKNLDDLA